MLRTLCAFLILFTSFLVASPTRADDTTTHPTIEEVVLLEQAREPVSLQVPEVAPPAIPPPVDAYQVTLRWLRALPPDQLIEIAWAGTGQTARALAIARRESGLRCNAKNPHSSASGLFQTLSLHRPRAERLGLQWSNITGPDCLDDVLLARAIYAESGWAPWRTH